MQWITLKTIIFTNTCEFLLYVYKAYPFSSTHLDSESVLKCIPETCKGTADAECATKAAAGEGGSFKASEDYLMSCTSPPSFWWS